MENELDEQYVNLMQDILDNGIEKQTPNGKTLSVFGRSIRYKFKDGKFPLITTKKMYWDDIVTELLWILRGETNIKFLVDNDCHILDGDTYKNYCKITPSEKVIGSDSDPLKNSMIWKRKTDYSSGYPIYERLSLEEFINKIKTDDEFAKKWGDLGPVHNKQWRSWGGKDDSYVIPATWNLDLTLQKPKELIKRWIKGTDQIANLIRDLKTNPDSKPLLVSAWNVGELDQQISPIYDYSFQFYTRELSMDERETLLLEIDDTFRTSTTQEVKLVLDELNIPTRAISLMYNARSQDVPLGTPFNIASYGLLLEIIAKAVNMVPDELIANMGDCHIYSNQIEQAKEQLNREPFPLPTLNINTEFWPYEGGECGIGPLDAVKVFEAFKDENFCRCLMQEDIQLSNYQYHP